MLILTSKNGRKTPEYCEFNKILRKVFFKADPGIAGVVLSSIVHTELHHGTKYVVNHFKKLKQIVLSEGKLSHRKSGLIRGLQKLTIVSRLRLLSMIGRWKAAHPKKEDYEKFIASIDSGRKFEPSTVPTKFRFTRNEIKSFLTYVDKAHPDGKHLFATGTHVLKNNTTGKGQQHIADEMIAMTDSGQLFLDHLDYLESIFDLTSDAKNRLIERAERHRNNWNVGRISGLVKDGALKTRYIANLMKGWQIAISPLVGFYKFIEGHYPQSANWDQLGGAYLASEATKDGFNLTSTDIVSSTDNIPRDLFFILMDPVIEELPDTKGGKLLRDAYKIDKELCQSGIYLTPFNQKAWYDIGQAMGRDTSKEQLNLTMIKATECCGGNEHNSRINGDDVIIWDDTVSLKFESLLEEWGIPISEQKSYSRLPNGEFSGRIITRDQGILPVYKGRKVNLPDDPFGAVRQYGKEGLRLLDRRDAKLLELIIPYSKEAANYKLDTAEPSDVMKNTVLKKNDVDKDLTGYCLPQGYFDQVFEAEKASVDADHYDQFTAELAVKPETSQELDNFNTLANLVKNITKKPGVVFDKKVRDDLKERSDTLHVFKHAGISLYPKKKPDRLKLFVDNLQAECVVTSDGWVIPDRGEELEEVAQRLQVLDDLKSLTVTRRDGNCREERLNRIRTFNKLSRKIARLQKAIKRDTGDITKMYPQFSKIYGKVDLKFVGPFLPIPGTGVKLTALQEYYRNVEKVPF